MGLALLILGLSACSDASSWPADAGPERALLIGVVAGGELAQQLLAAEQRPGGEGDARNLRASIRQRHVALTVELGASSGLSLRSRAFSSDATLIAALAAGEIDLAMLDPFPFLRAQEVTALERLAELQEREEPGAVVWCVVEDAKGEDLSAFVREGVRAALPLPGAGTGYLAAMARLVAAGVDPIALSWDAPYRARHGGGALERLVSGSAELAAAPRADLGRRDAQGRAYSESVRVIASGPARVPGVLVVREDLPESLRALLRAAIPFLDASPRLPKRVEREGAEVPNPARTGPGGRSVLHYALPSEEWVQAVDHLAAAAALGPEWHRARAATPQAERDR